MGNARSTISVKIKGQVAQSYFGSRSNDSNTTQDHIPSALILNTKNMFNYRSNSGPSPVPLLLPFRNLTTTRTFALKVFPVTLGLQALYCILGYNIQNLPKHLCWFFWDQEAPRKRCNHAHWRWSPSTI